MTASIGARTVVAACLVATLATAARASTGGADCYGYSWADNNSGCSVPAPAFGTGTSSFLAATAMQGPFPIGFTYLFHGLPYNDVYISPAGFVTFLPGQPPALGGTTPLPTPAAPNGLIAAYWTNCLDGDITIESTPAMFHVRWAIHRALATTIDAHLMLFPDGGYQMTWPITYNLEDATVGHENVAGTCGRTLYRDLVLESGPGGTFPYPSSGISACVTMPSLLDCSAPVAIACGASTPSQLPAAAARFAYVYSCVAGVFQGNERVFTLNIPTLETVSVAIDNPALSLLAVSNCDALACTAYGPQRLDYQLMYPGDYMFVVDKSAPGAGDAFNISVTCTNPFESLACETTLAGDTTGRQNLLDGYSCAPPLSGGERLYRYTHAAAGTFSASISSATANLWVLIFDGAAFDAGSRTCLSAGRGGTGYFNAPAGDYVVLVDGEGGASGRYDINLHCGELMDCSAARAAQCGQIYAGDTSGSASVVSIYACSGEALTGGEDIYTFFNPTEQAVAARFITQQPGQRMLLTRGCSESECYLTGIDGVACSLFPPGPYFLIIDSPAADEGAYSFQISCSDFVGGNDLEVTQIDASTLTTSCQSFDINGAINVGVTNLGTSPTPGPVEIVVFEDRIINGSYDAVGDNLLGRASTAAAITGGETAFTAIPCVGTVLFRDNTIYAMADPDGLVAEVRENNNLLDTGRACEYHPLVGPFSPTVEWEWRGSTTDPAYVEVDTNPLVADVNLDGIPDVVFVAGIAQFSDGVVRCVSGRGGTEIWTASDPQAHVFSSSNLALADIDGVPGPEIIGQSFVDRNRLVCIRSDGTFAWLSQPFIGHPAPGAGGGNGGGSPAIADLDNDGLPEIVYGANAFHADGTYFWTPQAGGTFGINQGGGLGQQDGALSVVADVNLDGRQDVVAGPTCYAWDPSSGTGRIMWTNPAVPDGYPAVGNFDSDDSPEIAITANGGMYVLEGDTGALLWSAVLPFRAGRCANVAGGPPTVADFDGDCVAEIGVSGSDLYTVYETDGSIKWSSTINDCSSHRTASSVFDFEGDGAAEVAFMDETLLHVFRGTTGEEIGSMPTESHTWTEMIAIADVDGDNNAEIVMPMNTNRAGGLNGIRVIGDSDDNWVNTRRIWNQHTYHITNINDDATVPGPFTGGSEIPSWRDHGTYRDQLGSAVYTAADYTVSIIETLLFQNAACQPQLTITARVGNGGGIPPGLVNVAAIYSIDRFTAARTDLGSSPVPDLMPGQYVDVSITVPFLLLDVVDVHASVDEALLVNECSENNNDCSVVVDASAPSVIFPGPVGPALRATGHGPVNAANITSDWNWNLDASAPRPAGVHFDIRRGETPTTITGLGGADHPWLTTTWLDSTPRSAARHVYYYLIIAADACENRSAD